MFQKSTETYSNGYFYYFENIITNFYECIFFIKEINLLRVFSNYKIICMLKFIAIQVTMFKYKYFNSL